jgi:3-phenylpropionate/trans-cinnamate dioxygenase ferredoxin subunit
MSNQRAASLHDVGVGELLRVDVGGVPVCLARISDREVCALTDTCSHEEASLSQGELWDGNVQCPLHGSLFDVRDGHVTGRPATEPVATYPVTVTDSDDILVDVG